MTAQGKCTRQALLGSFCQVSVQGMVCVCVCVTITEVAP